MAILHKNQKNLTWKMFAPIFILLIFLIGSLYGIKKAIGPRLRNDNLEELKIGAMIPDLSLTQMNNKEIQLSEIKAKIILVNFWATWCEACMSEMPSLVSLRTAFINQGFEILGINLDENPETVVPKTISQFGIGFPVFKDPNGKTAGLFDVHAIPLTVIIDNHRKILLIKDGEKDWNSPSVHVQLERWLTQ